MEEIDPILQQLENDPELRAIKTRISQLEAKIKDAVSEEAWLHLLDWEAEWVHYVTVCIQRLATACPRNRDASPASDAETTA